MFSPELEKKKKNAQNSYNSEYYENLDGSTAAGYINAKNEYDTAYTRGLDPALSSGRFNSENEYNKFLSDYELNVNRIVDTYLQKIGKRIRNIDNDYVAYPLAYTFHSVAFLRENLNERVRYVSEVLDNLIPL